MTDHSDPDDFSIECDTVCGSEWAEILLHFADANLFQTMAYGVEHFGGASLSHLVLKRNRQVVAAAQVWIRRLPLLGWGFAHVSWGPMWRRQGRPVDMDVVVNMLGALNQEYAVRRRLLLRVRTFEVDDVRDGAAIREAFRASGYYQNVRETPYHTYRLDLSPGLPAIRANFRKSWRKALNQAERRPLEVVEAVDDGSFQSLVNLYADMLARKGFSRYVTDVAEHMRIQHRLSEGTTMLTFLCRFEGEVVAGNTISAIGETALDIIAVTGSRSVELKLDAAYLLKWRIVVWLKEHGFRYYDLRGGIDGDTPGVRFFKGGMGGDDIRYLGTFERRGSLGSHVAVRSGEVLSSALARLETRKTAAVAR